MASVILQKATVGRAKIAFIAISGTLEFHLHNVKYTLTAVGVNTLNVLSKSALSISSLPDRTLLTPIFSFLLATKPRNTFIIYGCPSEYS